MCRESSNVATTPRRRSAVAPPPTPGRTMKDNAVPVTPAACADSRRVIDVIELDLDRRWRREERQQQARTVAKRRAVISPCAHNKRQRSCVEDGDSNDMPTLRLLPVLEQQLADCMVIADDADVDGSAVSNAMTPQRMPIALPVDSIPAIATVVSFDEDDEHKPSVDMAALCLPPLLPRLDWDSCIFQSSALSTLRPRTLAHDDDAIDLADICSSVEPFPLFPVA